LAVVDNDGVHIATIQVTRVEVVRFADAPDELALAEAEGDLNADQFRASHLAFWSQLGYEIEANTLIVMVFFDLIEDLRKQRLGFLPELGPVPHRQWR